MSYVRDDNSEFIDDKKCYLEMDWRVPLVCEDLVDRIKNPDKKSPVTIDGCTIKLENIKDGKLELSIDQRDWETPQKNLKALLRGVLSEGAAVTSYSTGRISRKQMVKLTVDVDQLMRLPEAAKLVMTGSRMKAICKTLNLPESAASEAGLELQFMEKVLAHVIHHNPEVVDLSNSEMWKWRNERDRTLNEAEKSYFFVRVLSRISGVVSDISNKDMTWSLRLPDSFSERFRGGLETCALKFGVKLTKVEYVAPNLDNWDGVKNPVKARMA